MDPATGSISTKHRQQMLFEVIRNDTTAAVAVAHTEVDRVPEGALVEAHRAAERPEQSKVCKHCSAQTSAAAGRPLDDPDGVRRKAHYHTDCCCARYMAVHSQCMQSVQLDTVRDPNSVTCGVCGSRTIRVSLVCGGKECTTLQLLCTHQCIAVYERFAPSVQRQGHLPMCLRNMTSSPCFQHLDIRPVWVNELLQSGYLQIQFTGKQVRCFSAFIGGGKGVVFQRKKHWCGEACKQYWAKMCGEPMLKDVRVLRLLCDTECNRVVAPFVTKECTVLNPCASCNLYAASQLKVLDRSEDTSRACAGRWCRWCRRTMDGRTLVKCTVCGCEQHEQCLVNALNTFSLRGPLCVLCSTSCTFAACEVAARGDGLACLQEYFPHWLFLSLFQHTKGLVVIDNMMYPLGILYMNKVGGFTRPNVRNNQRALASKSVADFWSVLCMVYCTCTSKLITEVVLRMVLFGDFFLSSMRGGRLVTHRLVRHINTVFADAQQRRSVGTAVSPDSFMRLPVGTSGFTTKEKLLLVECFLKCWNVSVCVDTEEDEWLRVTSVPATAVLSADYVLGPDPASFTCFGRLTCGDCSRHVRPSLDMKFEIDVKHCEEDEEEVRALEFISAALRLDVPERGICPTAYAVMHHYRKHGHCAVAVLYCARLRSVEVANGTKDSRTTSFPASYCNPWMSLGVKHMAAMVSERTNTASQQTVSTDDNVFVKFSAPHEHMYLQQNGPFPNALAQMSREEGMACLNGTIENGLVEVVAVHKDLDGEARELAGEELRAMLRRPASPDGGTYDVYCRALRELGQKATSDEKFAGNIPACDLKALCSVGTKRDVPYDDRTMLAVLLLRHCQQQPEKFSDAFLALVDVVVSGWISLFTQHRNKQGSPPMGAIF
ncbi:MAG: hypothetical protein CMI16_13230 [Opitutaceae bacterium]|nr:hypothetical protein [Opitutaceae bacterium]